MSDGLILCRGTLKFGQRYIGHSMKLDILRSADDTILIEFATDRVDDAANRQIFTYDQCAALTFHADNPNGRNIGFHFPLVSVAGLRWVMKDEDWARFEFLGTTAYPWGDLFNFCTLTTALGDLP